MVLLSLDDHAVKLKVGLKTSTKLNWNKATILETIAKEEMHNKHNVDTILYKMILNIEYMLR